MTVTLAYNATVVSSRPETAMVENLFAGGSYPLMPRRIPAFIPSADLFYWTNEWQAGEARSEQGLLDGDYREFDSDDPDDIVRWLTDDA